MKLPTITTVDPALGGGCAVITLALTAERLIVVDCTIDYGLSKTEQIIERIAFHARKYQPHLLIVEFDSQQKGLGNDDRLAALGQLCGFTIKPHLSRNKKNLDQVFGVASMDQSFRRGEVRIPWGDDDTKRKMEPLVTQLRKWRPDIPAKQLRQDAVMALWFGWKHWMEIRKAHDPVPEAMPVPSWLRTSPTQWLTRRAS